MPLPKTKSMKKMMQMLKKEKEDMPHKQMVAIAMKQTGKSKLSRLAKTSKKKY